MLNLWMPKWWCLAWELGEMLDVTGGTQESMLLQLVAVLVCAVGGYLLGSLNFAIIISRRLLHRDIRAHGSKNAGTTNMLRTYGTKYAVMTMVLDMLKGAFAAFLGYVIFVSHGAAVAGFFCVLGHMFPIYYRFKGGKGVATTGMVALMLDPWTFVALAVCFFGVTALSRYVSLGSIMSALIYPLALNAFFPNADMGVLGKGTVVLMGILTSAFVVFMHRANIGRLWRGEESKISFKKKKQEPTDAPPAGGEA